MEIIQTPKALFWLCHCRVLLICILLRNIWVMQVKMSRKVNAKYWTHLRKHNASIFFVFFFKKKDWNIRVILFIQLWLNIYVSLKWFIDMNINCIVIFSSGFSICINLYKYILMWLNLSLKLNLYIINIYYILQKY